MSRLALIIFAVLLASCVDGSFCPTPQEGWGRMDTLHLSPAWLNEALANGDDQEQAKEQVVNVNLVARLDRTFRYRQLRLKVNSQRVIVPVELQQGVGVCEAVMPIALSPCDTVLNITHLMWTDRLQGVISIGVTHINK